MFQITLAFKFWVQSALIPEEVNNVTPILKMVPAGITKTLQTTQVWLLYQEKLRENYNRFSGSIHKYDILWMC